MTFGTPIALAGLLLLPLTAALYATAQRRRRRYAVRFTNLDLLANVVSESPAWRRHIPPLLFLLALGALVLTLARPAHMVNVAKREATVMLVSDTSGSMQADDVGPTRLVAARDAAKSFVDRTPGKIKLGLVTFNSTSQLLVPPTNDRGRVKGTLDTMQAGGGTAIGSAIDTALAGLKPSLGNPKDKKAKKRTPPAVVVLLSDGKSTIGTSPLAAARRAHDLGVPVNTVALGTDAAVIQVNDPLGGFRSVPVPPDPASLKKIAQTTGGRFFAAKDAKHLGDIYKNLGRRIGFKRERRDLTPAFAGAGLVLMLGGGMLSLMWFGRLP